MTPKKVLFVFLAITFLLIATVAPAAAQEPWYGEASQWVNEVVHSPEGQWVAAQTQSAYDWGMATYQAWPSDGQAAQAVQDWTWGQPLVPYVQEAADWMYNSDWAYGY